MHEIKDHQWYILWTFFSRDKKNVLVVEQDQVTVKVILSANEYHENSFEDSLCTGGKRQVNCLQQRLSERDDKMTGHPG